MMTIIVKYDYRDCCFNSVFAANMSNCSEMSENLSL